MLDNPVTPSHARPISIAILAMGGQGGGVLADWLVGLAESKGYVAQSTSVPGVAQRTGATIYYVELFRRAPDAPAGAQPVLALMPVPGDVDIVVAAELMEAGRAIQRGLVTPDKTTLITAAHRAFAVQEKIVPGDGIGDGEQVIAAARASARRVIAFDLAALAERSGSVISSALFGALAGAEILPFARADFEATIRASGVGIEASLRAFAAAFDATRAGPAPQAAAKPAKYLPPPPARAGHPALDQLLARVAGFPSAAQPMIYAGVRRLVDYQDVGYANDYLDRLDGLLALDRAGSGAAHSFALTVEAAKQVAVAMAYDDVFRIADLKTRARRFARLRQEVGVKPDQILQVTEFMHPRMEELCGALPRRLGRLIETTPWLHKLLARRVDHGRRVRTHTVAWFLALYMLAAMTRFRRATLRHQRETAWLEDWLATVARHAPTDYALALELVKCRRLIKGYSDTHARGTSKFARVLGAAERLAGRTDAADWVRRLRDAALLDEAGTALDGALKTVESFSP